MSNIHKICLMYYAKDKLLLQFSMECVPIWDKDCLWCRCLRIFLIGNVTLESKVR